VSEPRFEKDVILQDLTRILTNMMGDWETEFSGAIRPETLLGADLGLESIDVVGLVIAIEEHYQRQDIPFVDLVMIDGAYVKDLSVGDLVEFLHRHLRD